jgi:hypothetical protein
LAIVAMPPYYYFSTNGSPKHFDLLTGRRAGSHFLPAKLTSTSARFSKLKIQNSYVVPRGHGSESCLKLKGAGIKTLT